MSRADRFDDMTLTLIGNALEEKAKRHEREAAALPREYATGVLTEDLRMRGVHVETARACREAIKTTRAMVDRCKQLSQAAVTP